jgi:teichuronic acid exporter
LILSRIYQPSDFALLAQVQSIAMIASIIITLQLHLTIPLAKSLEHAQDNLCLIQVLSAGIFISALTPAIMYGESAIFALLLSLSLGLANTYTGFLVYSGSFGKMSVFYVTRALLIIVMQISFAGAGLENGLVIATLVAETLSALYLGLKTGNRACKINLKFLYIKTFVVKNKSFSFYGTVQEVVSVSSFYAPLLLFNIKYGEEIGGQYAMASRIIWAPIVLISSSWAQVLSHTYGRAYPSQPLGLISHFNWKVMLLLTIGCGVGFLSQPIFNSALGVKWGLASQIMPLQILWGAFFILSTPFRVACRVMRLQKYQLMSDAMALSVFSIILLSFDLLPLQSMWVIVIASFLHHALLSVLIFKRYKIQMSNVGP